MSDSCFLRCSRLFAAISLTNSACCLMLPVHAKRNSCKASLYPFAVLNCVRAPGLARKIHRPVRRVFALHVASKASRSIRALQIAFCDSGGKKILWHREMMVGRRASTRLVVRMNMVSGPGSSSSFRKAFAACVWSASASVTIAIRYRPSLGRRTMVRLNVPLIRSILYSASLLDAEAAAPSRLGARAKSTYA